MTSKGIITSARETVVAAGKSAAEGAKALAGEVANAAVTAAATAKAATMAAANVVLDKVATTIEERKPSVTSVQETVVAAGKSAAEGAKTLAGEVANAAATTAATATAAATAAAGVVLDKVATTIEAGPLKEPKRLLANLPLRLRPAWSWTRLRRRQKQVGPVPARRKRSRKEWLPRNALHQRRRPTQRKRPARLVKRNEFNASDELVLAAGAGAAAAGSDGSLDN